MRVSQYSFGSGEISPGMQGRIDSRQYQSGVKTCSNFEVLPQGSVKRRSGSRYCGRQWSQAYDSRLIPFVFSTDDALIIEFSQNTVQFWQDGEPVHHSTPIGGQVASIDTTANSITFTEKHQFDGSEVVRFVWADGSNSEFGLTAGTDYTVTVVDANTITVGTSLSGTLDHTTYCFLASDMPADYQPPLTVANASWGTTAHHVTSTAHGFVDDQTVTLTAGTTLPTGLLESTVYYVVNATANDFQLSLTEGGTPVEWTGTGSGNHVVNRYYRIGEHVYWDNNTAGAEEQGFYYHRTDAAETGSEPSGQFTQVAYNGRLEILQIPYAASELAEMRYVQSNDVVTLTHPNYAPRELRRLAADWWDIRTVSFGSSVGAPTGGAASETRGEAIQISGAERLAADVVDFFTDANHPHPFVEGDAIYVGPDVNGSAFANVDSNLLEDTTYVVMRRINANRFSLREVDGTPMIGDALNVYPTAGSNYNFSTNQPFYYSSLTADIQQSYKLTSIDPDGIESTASAAFTADNMLEINGAYNTLSWTAVTGAQKYRVYKQENGLYGYIGESDGTSFVDDNIAPDLGRTPPIADDDLSGTDYPQAAAYFEQRRVFAGTTLKPRNLWMTKSGTESDLTYSLPIQDTDRISIALAAREAATIRHIVPLSDMLILTQQGEWRLFAINSDAITPETVAVRQQSEIGASVVRPLVVNNTVVFCANRGGHVRQLAYNFEAQGFLTGDLSLRAAHLFDNRTLRDSAYQQSPYPIMWFVSSTGDLLACTFIPEEEVVAWHKHDLGGTVTSVCVIPEGDQDTVYVSVRRTVGGSTLRYVERLVPNVVASLVDGIWTDSTVTWNGTSPEVRVGAEVTVTGGEFWTAGESVTVTANEPLFSGRSEDVGNDIELRDGAGGTYRLRITAYTSSTVVTAKIQTTVPSAFRNTLVFNWAYAARTIGGLSHLEGETVQVVADGAYVGTKTVTGGQVSLSDPAAVVHVGLGYNSDLETLPQVWGNVEGYGQGLTKNVQDVWLKVYDTAGLQVGPSLTDLVDVDSLTANELTTGEVETSIPSEWTQVGEIAIRQSVPQPATIVGLTLQTREGG